MQDWVQLALSPCLKKKRKKKQRYFRSGRQELFCKNSLFKIFQNLQNTETPALESLSNNIVEFCEIFKNTSG